MKTKLTSFSSLQERDRDLLFDGRESAGIIPYNVGLLEHGKLMLTIVGETSRDVESLYEEVCRRSHNVESQARGCAMGQGRGLKKTSNPNSTNTRP